MQRKDCRTKVCGINVGEFLLNSQIEVLNFSSYDNYVYTFITRVTLVFGPLAIFSFKI